MEKQIKIISSRLIDEENRTRIEYLLDAAGKPGVLWFRFLKKWKEYICDNLADGIIVTLLLYAIRGGFDIASALPVSRVLLNRLNNHVIPQLALCTKDGYNIKIICPDSSEEFHPDRVATAMSMGVDSFTTFFEYTADCPPESDRINLLTFMQSGQTSFAENEEEVFFNQLSDAERFAKEYGYDMLDISSNIYSLYTNLFGLEPMIHVSTYRNCGMILLFQKLIKTYYYSSSYNLDEFVCDLEKDVTYYEKWLIPNISTGNTTIYNSNKAMSRFEKTKYICSHRETYNYLQVCCKNRHACGECNKCIRTMFTLEYLGSLDNYRNVFDVDSFRSRRKYNLVQLYMAALDSSIDAEVVELYKNEYTPIMKLIAGYSHFKLNNKTAHGIERKLYQKHPKLKKMHDLIMVKIGL